MTARPTMLNSVSVEAKIRCHYSGKERTRICRALCVLSTVLPPYFLVGRWAVESAAAVGKCPCFPRAGQGWAVADSPTAINESQPYPSYDFISLNFIAAGSCPSPKRYQRR